MGVSRQCASRNQVHSRALPLGMDTALDLAAFVSRRASGSQKGPEFSRHIQESPGRRKCPRSTLLSPRSAPLMGSG